MNTQTRISLVIGVVAVLVIGAFLFFAPGSNKKSDSEADKAPSEDVGSALSQHLVRENSLVLGEKGSSDVTLVEFADMQCPSCAAMHPVIEELREKYEGKVTFVLRQFPLEMHANARDAALAVDAAAQQDEHVAMIDALFTGQTEWSNLGVDEAKAWFRSAAEKIGLDLDAYDAALTEPATAERVEEDLADGDALGVSGTPTLFVNGTMLNLQNYSDVEDAIVEALGDGVDA